MAGSPDPHVSAKKALLRDRKSVQAYGSLLIETGAYRLPPEILLGVLLEGVSAFDNLDKERMEVLRSLGERFRREDGKPKTLRTGERASPDPPGESAPKAANEG